MQKGLAPLLPRCQLEPRMQEVLNKCRHGGAGPLGHLADTAGGVRVAKGRRCGPRKAPGRTCASHRDTGFPDC